MVRVDALERIRRERRDLIAEGVRQVELAEAAASVARLPDVTVVSLVVDLMLRAGYSRNPGVAPATPEPCGGLRDDGDSFKPLDAHDEPVRWDPGAASLPTHDQEQP